MNYVLVDYKFRVLFLLFLQYFVLIAGETNNTNSTIYPIRCAVYSPDFMNCVLKQYPAVMKLIQDGNVASRIPALNPFFVNYIAVPVEDGIFELIRSKTFGITDMEIRALRINFKKNIIAAKFSGAKLDIKSRYKMFGGNDTVHFKSVGYMNMVLNRVVIKLLSPYIKVKEQKKTPYFNADMHITFSEFVGTFKPDNDTDEKSRQSVDDLNKYMVNNCRRHVRQITDTARLTILPIWDRIASRIDFSTFFFKDLYSGIIVSEEAGFDLDTTNDG